MPFSSPGYLPKPGTEPESPALQVDSLPFEPPEKTNTYTLHKKITQRWITDLNVKYKLKLLEGAIGENLDDFGFDNDT